MTSPTLLPRRCTCRAGEPGAKLPNRHDWSCQIVQAASEAVANRAAQNKGGA